MPRLRVQRSAVEMKREVPRGCSACCGGEEGVLGVQRSAVHAVGWDAERSTVQAKGVLRGFPGWGCRGRYQGGCSACHECGGGGGIPMLGVQCMLQAEHAARDSDGNKLHAVKVQRGVPGLGV